MMVFSQSDDLALHSRSQLRLKIDKCLTCTILTISVTLDFKLGIAVDIYAYYALARFDDLDPDARSQWIGKGKNISVDLS